VIVKEFFGDAFERRELVDAGIVHQNVQLARRLFWFLREEADDVGCLRDVGLHGDGFAALGGDLLHDAIGAFLAGGVIDDDGGALSGKRDGDRRADSFGRAVTTAT